MLAELEDVQTILQNIEEAIGEKVAHEVALKRSYEKKSEGTVTTVVDGIEVVSTVPKRVTWDQDLLDQVCSEMELEALNPMDWIDYKLSVSETNYKKMPSHARALVDKARVVKHGKEKIELRKINND